MRDVVRPLGLLCLSLALALPARAGGGSPLAAPLGTLQLAPDGRTPMELLALGREAAVALLELRDGESMRVDSWPLAPSQRAASVLRPLSVYARDARIVLVRNGTASELPRSTLRFFSGTVAEGEDAGSRFLAWIDPATLGVGGLAMTRAGATLLVPPDVAGEERSRLAPARAFRGDDVRLDWRCGADEASPAPDPAHRDSPSAAPGAPSPLSVTRTAVIAIDTDAEYLDRRFSDNTTNAVNYIAQIIAGTSVIYERDAGVGAGNGVKVLQGYTIIRVGEASDPYSDTEGNVVANDPRLTEFRNYWNANYPSAAVKRALAAMLSGRQGPRCTSSCSASGIASLGVLCGTSGYSLNLLFNGNFGLDLDLSIFAHEVGHNFGAPHTHNCAFSPPIDTCLAAEGGCALQGSCPAPQTINGVANVTGTLMSYCHLRAQQDCSSSLVFHPRSISDPPTSNGILDDIQAAGCLAAVSGSVPAAPAVTDVSAATGGLAGGQSVTVTGTGFVSGASVTFVELPSNDVFGSSVNAKAAPSVVFGSSTSLTAVTPSATNAGAVDVVVMNPDQQTGTLRNGFTYQTVVNPTVSGIAPNNGSTLGGTAVTITGTGFLSGAGVTIGGGAATGVAVPNATTITATTPSHATGLANVVVTNPGGASGTLTGGFFYVPPPASSVFHTLAPCRAADTRNAAGALGGPALSAGQRRSFPVTSSACGVPAGAKALSVNVTVAAPAAAGYLTLYPGNGLPAGSSSLNFRAGQTRANNAVVLLATDGSGALGVLNGSAGTVHVIVDVNGYFQ